MQYAARSMQYAVILLMRALRDNADLSQTLFFDRGFVYFSCEVFVRPRPVLG
jgi:hypothetical protein